jgi:large subunit ribosomal protein L20
MPRVTRGIKKQLRREEIYQETKGFRGTRRKNYKTAKTAMERALQYAYRDRRAKKRDFRRLWNIRINAGAKLHGLNYSRLINMLKVNNIGLNRKMLANLAAVHPEVFESIIKTVKN